MQPTSLPALSSIGTFLDFRRIFFLRGPNIWSRRPCMEVWVDLGDLKDFSSELIPGFNDRYKSWLPSVIEHRCSVGERGGFFQRLDRGTYLAHILEHTVLELQTLAGSNVGFGRARETSEEGVYKVAIRYEEESLAKECLSVGRELLKSCVYDLPFDVASEIRRLHDLADRRCLGPSTRAIVDAAEKRNIPFRRLNQGSLVLLGQGGLQRRIWTAESDQTGAIAESIAQDKELTKQLLSAVGVPVPEGRSVSSPDDAVEAAEEIESAVVVKPLDANHGRGVVPNLTLPSEIRNAYDVASREGSGVLVERFVPGYEHRLLVVGDRLVAASKGEPVTVTADGRRTVRQLVEEVVNADPRRGEDEILPLSPIEIDESLCMILEHQGLTLDSIPPTDKRVLVKRHDNLSHDVTDQVHPSVADHAILAAKTVGLDIAGIDLVALDVSCPLEDQGGAIVEVNAGPGLIMHLKPLVGTPRPVGEAIVEHLFGITGDARIPTVCVTGTSLTSETVTRIGQLLNARGWSTGTATKQGMAVAGRTIVDAPSDHAQGARNLLVNSNVSAMVMEASGLGILREGLGIDKCHVAVVTEVAFSGEEIAEYDIREEEKFFGIYRTPVDVVMEHGCAVLNAADAQCLAMKPLSKGAVTLFDDRGRSEPIQTHLQAGGRAVITNAGLVQCLSGPDAKIEFEHPCERASRDERLAILASIAVAWHLNITWDIVRDHLAAFTS